MGRRLKQMKIAEVSFVNSAANRKTFLIIKEQKCPDCGGILKHDRIGGDDSRTQLECSGCGKFIKTLFRKEGFVMNALIKVLKQFLGDDFQEFSSEETEVLKSMTDEATGAIEKSMALMLKYQSDMPEDLQKAVGVIASYAVGQAPYPYPVFEEKDEEILNKFLEKYKKDIVDLEKAGKRLSKDTIEKLKDVIKSLGNLPNVIKTLESLLPDGEKVDKSSDDDDTSKKLDDIAAGIKKEVTDMVAGITTSITKMTDANQKTAEEIKKSSEDIAKRLETLEKVKGTKKSIDGDDDDDDDNLNKSDKGNFPSIVDAMFRE